MKNGNVGIWSAKVKKDNLEFHLLVEGIFYTNGQKPSYRLEKSYPQGIIESELLLTLHFGSLAGDAESIQFQVNYSEYIETIDKYRNVHIKDENGETLAYISVENESFDPFLEVLKGVDFSKNLLKIRVPSKGQTTKDSIRVKINKGFTEIPPFSLEIYRVASDNGKAFLPDGVTLEYEPKELGEEDFVMYNLANTIG